MTVFGTRLSKLMELNELSQKELASLTGVTESAISYYINGERTPRSDVLARIAKALNTTTDYLLGAVPDYYPHANQEELQYLQRNLGKLDAQQLKKAENILKTVFDDIFDDNDDEE